MNRQTKGLGENREKRGERVVPASLNVTGNYDRKGNTQGKTTTKKKRKKKGTNPLIRPKAHFLFKNSIQRVNSLHYERAAGRESWLRKKVAKAA